MKWKNAKYDNFAGSIICPRFEELCEGEKSGGDITTPTSSTGSGNDNDNDGQFRPLRPDHGDKDDDEIPIAE